MDKGRITRKNNLSSSSPSSLPVRPQLLQIQIIASFSFCVGQGGYTQQHYKNVHMLLCRPHSGMITGLEANSRKELERALWLTAVVAHDLFGPTSTPSAGSQTTGSATCREFRKCEIGEPLQSRLWGSAPWNQAAPWLSIVLKVAAETTWCRTAWGDRQYCSTRTYSWCKLLLEKWSCVQLFVPMLHCTWELDWGTGWFKSNPAFLEVRKKSFTQVSSLMWITVHWHGCSWHGCEEETVSAAVLGYADTNCTALIKIRSNLNRIKFKQKWGMPLMRLLQNSHVSDCVAGWNSKDTTRNLRGDRDCLSANLKCRPRAFFNFGFLWAAAQEVIK